jgi:hypothetical protein
MEIKLSIKHPLLVVVQMWLSAGYYDKQRLQYLLFPEGILYDNKTKRVLTNRVNVLFREIAELARVLGENKNDNPSLDCHFGSQVGMTAASSNFWGDLKGVRNF